MSANQGQLTQEELFRVATYNPDTGLFSRNLSERRWKAGQIMGTPHIRGYVEMTVCGQRYLAHRLAFLYMEGLMPLDQVDHINGVKTDNRFSNLRKVSCQENQKKNLKISKRNKSGVMGVCWHKDARRWAAEIRISGKKKHLGLFDSIEEAAIARREAEKFFGFHPMHGQKKVIA